MGVWHNPDVIKSAAKPAKDDTPKSSDADRAKDPPRSGRIVARQADTRSEREIERDKLLEKLRVAEGRIAITKAADDLFKAEHELPDDDQLVWLQLLEHSDEARVRVGLEKLALVFAVEPPKRFAVLDSRLRRLEEFADEGDTREAAAALRRRVKPQGSSAARSRTGS